MTTHPGFTDLDAAYLPPVPATEAATLDKLDEFIRQANALAEALGELRRTLIAGGTVIEPEPVYDDEVRPLARQTAVLAVQPGEWVLRYDLHDEYAVFDQAFAIAEGDDPQVRFITWTAGDVSEHWYRQTVEVADEAAALDWNARVALRQVPAWEPW